MLIHLSSTQNIFKQKKIIEAGKMAQWVKFGSQHPH